MSWWNVALKAKDQLRQRVAWALSQVLVVSEEGVGKFIRRDSAEGFTAYYDIFVRNAFGNYRDVLKEVSFSPMMGYMLTYIDGRKDRPDENYAREVMQLFSMGVYQINEDGTQKLDANGKAEASYSIEDVESLARAWTGFRRSAPRGNIEHATDATAPNYIDPMVIHMEDRDQTPKRAPGGGFIGDGFPQCTDLPSRGFLRKGATYRYLGRSPVTVAVEDPQWYSKEGKYSSYAGSSWDWTKRNDLGSTSLLAAALCGSAAAGGLCQLKGEVTLPGSLACTGMECEVDTVRSVGLVDGLAWSNGTRYTVYYEYVHQPCVHLAYFENPTLVTGSHGTVTTRPDAICADPLSTAAAAACCSYTDDKFGVNSAAPRPMCDTRYTNERVTLATAAARCEARGEALCNAARVFKRDATDNCDLSADGAAYFWSTATRECSMLAQVHHDGRVSVIDQAPEVKPIDHAYKLRPNSDTWLRFSVAWKDGAYPTVGATGNCSGACTVHRMPSENGDRHTDTCVCPTEVVKQAVFTDASKLPTREEIITQLAVGAVDPAAYDSGTYVKCTSALCAGHPDVAVYHLGSSAANQGLLDVTTIFQIADTSKRASPLFFRNFISTVRIGSHSFRNPPSFHSRETSIAAPSWKRIRSQRDGHDETDALLDFYLNNKNTPPFVAMHLIQRFGTSNPSPRYVKAVAAAFKTGEYATDGSSFGTGVRGDLAATVAAVILDREASSPLLDSDPDTGSLREPVLKVAHIMRAMEFSPTPGLEEIAIETWPLQQGPYAAPSVFSFFQSDNQPGGALAKAGLHSPEALILTAPLVTNWINRAYALFEQGLNEHSFGDYRARGVSWGRMSFNPAAGSTASEVVDELDVLLTQGRLSALSREVIEGAYTSKLASTGSADKALVLAEQLITTTPEFHASTRSALSGATRMPPAEGLRANASPYKAVVVIFLFGGADSFNMLVPYDGCDGDDMYAQYSRVRGSVAIPKSLLLPIVAAHKSANHSTQVCGRFGLHPSMENLQRIYNDGDALMVANMGTLVESVTQQDLKLGATWESSGRRVPSQLFNHQFQRRQANTVMDASNTVVDSSGVVGRMMDALAGDGFSTGSYSTIGRRGLALETITSKDYEVVSSGGVPQLTTHAEELLPFVENLTSHVRGS